MNPIQNSRPCGVSRRTLLKVGLGAGVAGFPLPGIIALAQFKADPFSLGVASGDPADDGFVIWTRLAPDPLAFRGGMALASVVVDWEVAADPQMKQIVQSGSAIARVELAHAVHVEIVGLEPARDYFYRLRAGSAESPIGRSRTLPLRGADVAQLRFGSAGCQAWENGYYTAWRRIAEENFDFVCHYAGFSDLRHAGRLSAALYALQGRSRSSGRARVVSVLAKL